MGQAGSAGRQAALAVNILNTQAVSTHTGSCWMHFSVSFLLKGFLGNFLLQQIPQPKAAPNLRQTPTP
jgi:hypothetical protein